MNPPDAARIGIDLGGTKIEGLLLSGDDAIVRRLRVPTPRHDYAKTLGAIAKLIADLERSNGPPASIGIGTPGAVSPATGRIKNANSVWLNDKPLVADLQRLLGRPVRLANDADCFTLSEASDGSARGAGVVFGVIIGTGVGGGIVVDGKLLQGPNAIAGEWGHNPLPWPRDDERPGPECYCGKSGCIETYLSGPGLERDHLDATGAQLAAAEIAQRAAQAKDRSAEATLMRYEERLARSLSGVINVLDPTVIVLGGGLSRLERLYANVPPLLRFHVFSDRVDTRLTPPTHGDSSGVLGAARLWDA